MTESLRAAADLVEKLGPIELDEVLPATEPVIDCDALAVHKIELRQVAGISAGGRLELSAGCQYDFGPVRRGHGQLDDGRPDSVGFTLRLDEELTATIGPGSSPVSIDAEAVTEPTDVGDRIIDAGSACFVVARPRPPRMRGGGRGDELAELHPWVESLVPEPIADLEATPETVDDLLDRRRRLHAGADEICHRIEGGGALLWGRTPGHPLFGTAVAAMTNVDVQARGLVIQTPVPVSVDLLASPTMLIGERSLQLAVARHLLISLATTVGPEHVAIELRSGQNDLGFVADLPHATSTADHRLVVIDRATGRDRLLPPGLHTGDTSFMVLAGNGEALSANADVLSIVDEATINLIGANCDDAPFVEAATPVGYARSMTAELVKGLRRA